MGTSLLWQTDTQLHDAVQHQLDWEPEFNAHDIAMTASDGVIALTGFVNSYAEKLAAEQTVKRVRGVRGVANDIQVKLRDERTDPEIAKDAVYALRTHTSVPNRTTVTVRNGFLTLEGTVEWMYQKAAAGSAVMFVKGVKGVSNRILISPEASTGEVKIKIEEALRRSAEVDARRVRVDVDHSTVTLSGDVHSWTEKQEAERAAWAAPGVTHVENHIAVTP
jgi:osmotically-inducible protein OsmY